MSDDNRRKEKRQNEIERIYAELLKCHYKARKAKRKTYDEHNFEVNLFENIMRIAVSIVDFKYMPSPGIAFVTRKPVLREIFAAPYRDRVVHHFIFEHVIDYWEKQFIYDSYSCREGKGTLKGIRRVEKFVRAVSDNYTKEAFVFKYDLTGYFMSLPRKQLYNKAIQGLNEQYTNHNGYDYRYLKYLWGKVIFNDPKIGVELRGSMKNWEELPRTKSLFCQPKNQGIVIGNLTSQLLSNIYLNDFDHYMKEWLGYKYYARYVDDFLVLVDAKNKEQVRHNEEPMELFLNKKNLRLNNKKTYRQNIDKGIAFLGVVIYPGRTVMGKRVKQNMFCSARRFANGGAGVETLVSYAGMTVHHDCVRLTEKMLNAAGVV